MAKKKKPELLKEARRLGLELTMKNTVVEIKAAIKGFVPPVDTKKFKAEYPAAIEKEMVGIHSETPILELLVPKPRTIPKFKKIRALISYSEKAGVGKLTFQDLENTGNKFDITDIGFDFGGLKTFLVETTMEG